MATSLTKPISRETSYALRGRKPRNVIITLAPLGSQADALVGFRPKGRRIQYVARVSDLFRIAALWHGQREAVARKAARKAGTSWRLAKRQFAKENTIQKSRAAD